MSDSLDLDLSRFRVAAGDRPRLHRRDPADTGGLSKKKDEARVRARVADHADRANELQEKLYAERTRSVLVVLQAMDAAGKDSTVEHVFGRLNPQGVRVWNFKKPTGPELAHDFLWRVHKRAPGAGYIRVFNRSHYEDVLIVKVRGWAPPEEIDRRYGHINHFESLLADRGTQVVKLFLHVSKEYQRDRLRRRLRRPDKHWKFNPADLDERAKWDEYQDAYETALHRCSTAAAPWYVIPAEERWFRDLVVSQILRETLEELDPRFPAPTFDPADYPPESIE